MQKIVLFLITLFFIGCAEKELEYNKPAIYWYQKIIKECEGGDLEMADDYFVSLKSEHINSPLIKEAMLILAQAHMQEEEYLLANFYLDEFIKRYGDSQNIEFAKFLKIRANFLSFKLPYRDQLLLSDTIKEAREFINLYPNSNYRQLVDTILTKMELSQVLFNKEIARLYNKLDKSYASEYYMSKIDSYWSEIEIVPPSVGIVRNLFE